MKKVQITALRFLIFLICSSIWVVFSPAVFAQENPTQDDVNVIAKKLFCPVCENTPLDVCPTEACQQWRDVIRTKIAKGQTEAQILDYFATMYGDSVLAEPPPRQLVAWLLPVLIVLAASALLVYWIHSWTQPAPPVGASNRSQSLTIDESDPYVIRLEKELAQWK